MKNQSKEISVEEFRRIIGVDDEQRREKRAEAAPVEQADSSKGSNPIRVEVVNQPRAAVTRVKPISLKLSRNE